MRYKFVWLVCLIISVSCDRDEPRGSLPGQYDVSTCRELGFYSMDGINSFTVQSRYQTAVNQKRLTYRVQNSDQSRFIHVRFDQKPVRVGQAVAVTVSSKDVFKTAEHENLMVVKSEEGMIWMSGNSIGIVMQAFD